MKNINKKRITVSWILVILWMIVIFSFSAQTSDNSNQLSGGISQLIMQFIARIPVPAIADGAGFTLEFLVRKAAHFTEYMILGVLVCNAFRQMHTKAIKSGAWALLICAVYAISDEIHQIFVPGRSCQLRDVIIDSSGALVGILLISLVFYLKYSSYSADVSS